MPRAKNNMITFLINIFVTAITVFTVMEIHKWQENLIYAITITLTAYGALFQIIAISGMLLTGLVRVYYNLRNYANSRVEYLRLYNKVMINIEECSTHNIQNRIHSFK